VILLSISKGRFRLRSFAVTGLTILFLSSPCDTFLTTNDLTIHPHFVSPHPSHLAPGVGSGEFLLIDEKNPEKVHLVVRTINSSAFSNEDWEEYVYEVSSTEHIRLGPVQDHYLQNGDLTICRFSFVDMLMRWIGTVPL
jgi:hypothetical protein